MQKYLMPQNTKRDIKKTQKQHKMDGDCGCECVRVCGSTLHVNHASECAFFSGFFFFLHLHCMSQPVGVCLWVGVEMCKST